MTSMVSCGWSCILEVCIVTTLYPINASYTHTGPCGGAQYGSQSATNHLALEQEAAYLWERRQKLAKVALYFKGMLSWYPKKKPKGISDVMSKHYFEDHLSPNPYAFLLFFFFSVVFL